MIRPSTTRRYSCLASAVFVLTLTGAPCHPAPNAPAPLAPPSKQRARRIRNILHQALRLTRGVKDKKEKSSLLAQMSVAYLAIGDRQDATRILDAAIDTAASIPDRFHAMSALEGIISEMRFKSTTLEIGSQGAKKVLDKVWVVAQGADFDRVSWLFAHLLGQYAEVHSIQGALEEAGKIEDRDARSRSMLEVADKQIEAGDLDGALRTWEQSGSGDDEDPPDSFLMVHRQQILARIHRMKGDTDAALKIALSIADEDDRDRAVAELAEQLAESGNGDRARLVVSQIKNVANEARALAGVARGLGRKGDWVGYAQALRRAIEANEKVADPLARAEALGDIGWAQLTTGFTLSAHGSYRRALQLAIAANLTEELKPHRRDAQIYTISSFLHYAGDKEGSLIAAEAIGDASLRDLALSSISLGSYPVLNGDEDPTMPWDSEFTLRVLGRIKDGSARAYAFRWIGVNHGQRKQLRPTPELRDVMRSKLEHASFLVGLAGELLWDLETDEPDF